MTTSFKKKTTNRGRVCFPNGTRPSVANNQLLSSTGIPSLDHVLGGGLAVGTILLIEEDNTGAYAELMAKYFLAEGVMCNHSLFVASRDKESCLLMKTLPGHGSETEERFQDSSKRSDDNLEIAWRYKNLGQDKSHPQSALGHTFDLSCTMSESDLERCRVYHHAPADAIIPPSIPRFLNASYGRVLHEVSGILQTDHFSTAVVRNDQNILRIGLLSFGSPSWEEHDRSNLKTCLPWFITALKASVRNAYATVVITVPMHLFEDDNVQAYLEHVCDAAIAIESFAGSDKEQNPAFKDYHGLLKVKKLPCINSLAPVDMDTTDLAFKLKRKKFCIEKLHLPPELSETANRTQSDPVATAQKSGIPLCGVTAKSLDF